VCGTRDDTQEAHVDIARKVVVVTGGASGIGRALCERFAAEGAAVVVVADLDEHGAAEVAASITSNGTRGVASRTDVASGASVASLVERSEDELGPIDLFCSNAGIGLSGGVDAPDDDWDRIWRVNVMSHVFAARALLPRMVARGGGTLVVTASAAGLLTNLGSAPYSVTKHAAVALAEWLAITHGDDGIIVQCLCPQGVRTPLLERGLEAGEPAAATVLAVGAVLEPAAVAGAVVDALGDGRFLILPHPEVARYVRHRAEDPDRWLAAMRALWARHR
jgi:NAD(P)-dependent dehydrogenase (short-subunit alcohol dehydrogenase family)